MTISLPPRPSLESLRKQAKKLARDVSAGDADALARVRAHLPAAAPPLTQRNAQFVIAREYGFSGWRDLTAEVRKRLGNGLEWAAAEAKRVIHDNDVERLKELVTDYPDLLSWRGDNNARGVLGMATSTYAFDVGTPNRERDFARATCAELLIDAGAVVAPSLCDNILQARARGLLALFQRKGLLPRTLKFLAALGDIDGVRGALEEHGYDSATVNEAFVRACLFGHSTVATVLLDRAIALDRELAEKLETGVARTAFIECFVETRPEHIRAIAGRARTAGLWKTFVVEEVSRLLEGDDVEAFVAYLKREPWLLGDAWIDFQNELMGGRAEFLTALLDLEPAILRAQPPPASQAIEWALMHGNTHLLPLLTRIWSVPDDLPSAAAVGDLARVEQWFDGAGTVRDVASHYPYNDARARSHLHWDPPSAQQVLDVSFAFAVINSHFDVADFLLARGANIDTNWNSHEPASILHFLVFLPNPHERMQYLIDRGIDMTIKDYRWDSNAAGWARFGNNDEALAQWLEAAERGQQRER